MTNAMAATLCVMMLAGGTLCSRARAQGAGRFGERFDDVHAADLAAIQQPAEQQAAPKQAKPADDRADRDWKARRQLEEEEARRQAWIREHGNAKPQRLVAKAPRLNAAQLAAVKQQGKPQRAGALNPRRARPHVDKASYDVEAARRAWIAAKSVAARRGNLARGNAIAASNNRYMAAQFAASARRSGW